MMHYSGFYYGLYSVVKLHDLANFRRVCTRAFLYFESSKYHHKDNVACPPSQSLLLLTFTNRSNLQYGLRFLHECPTLGQ